MCPENSFLSQCNKYVQLFLFRKNTRSFLEAKDLTHAYFDRLLRSRVNMQGTKISTMQLHKLYYMYVMSKIIDSCGGNGVTDVLISNQCKKQEYIRTYIFSIFELYTSL